MRSELTIIDLGRTAFEEVWSLQRKLVALRAEGQGSDALLFAEHPPVITCGRGAREKPADQDATIPWYWLERGGGITYHGPGQLVGYPILRLRGERRDIHRYLRDLETVLISTLRSFDLHAARRPGYTGVWVRGKKIASIGIAVKRWVTFHGFALNVNTDLSWFRRIQPCGMEGSVMTSMELLLGAPAPFEEVQQTIVAQFELVFGVTAKRLGSADSSVTALLDPSTGGDAVDLSPP